jgi:ribonuclease E
MDEKKPSSSWDDLVRQVGAEPAPDALERRRPAIETTFEAPAAPVPAAKPKAGDWGALASQLGVEATEPPAPPARPAKRADAPARPHAPTAGELEASFAGIAPIESEFENIVEDEIQDVDFSDDNDSDLEEPTAEERGDDDALSGEAARNAFEALFQAGSFSALPRREPREPRPQREPRAPRDESGSKDRWGRPTRAAHPPRDEDDDLPSDERSLGDDGAAAEPTSASDEDGERPRKRRRRGRGRGRGRTGREGREGRQSDAAERAPARDKGDEEDEEWQEALSDEALSDDADAEDDGAPAPQGDEERPPRAGWSAPDRSRRG